MINWMIILIIRMLKFIIIVSLIQKTKTSIHYIITISSPYFY